MKYVACKNIINKSDTLYVNESLLTGVSDLCILVNNWLVDRGCDNKALLDKVGKGLHEIYKGKLTYLEHNSELFQVIIRTDKMNIRYEIIFNYKMLGELTYKALEDEHKD